ncbi:MAG: hypothetical protein ACOYM7_02745 [Paludibacter sp.]
MEKKITLNTAFFSYVGIKGNTSIIDLYKSYEKRFFGFENQIEKMDFELKMECLILSIQDEENILNNLPIESKLHRELHLYQINKLRQLLFNHITKNSTTMNSIDAIEKHLETITEISDKIIYLINTKAEHEKYAAGLPEIAKKWLGDNNFSKQCDALITKYDYLLKLAPAPQPKVATEKTQKPFAGAKIIDVYDPKKIHNEFKNELKCDYQTFKAWFVDSVICEKQMSWKYDNENKTQLRSFIYVLCGGWKPAETNTAFKISVDSNVRECNINSNLLQRIEKCSFK